MNKTVFFNIANPFILRNFLVVPEATPYRLLRKGIRVVILVPRQARDRVQKDFGNSGQRSASKRLFGITEKDKCSVSQ